MIAAWRNRRALQRCNTVGFGVRIDGPIHIENRGRISLGDSVVIASVPVPSHLVTGPQGLLRIGRGVALGHGASIACHKSVTIGDHVSIGPFVMLLDTDFHEAGRHEASGTTAPIEIGAGARLGARVTVLRGSSIGAGATVAAGSVVKGVVPPLSHVSGNPARVAMQDGRPSAIRPIDLDSVIDVVAFTFGLRERPDPRASRLSMPQWDSLGMLNLLLSLEQAFGVPLSSAALLAVDTVADLVPVLEREVVA